MATYTSDKVGAAPQTRTPVPGGVAEVLAKITVGTALALNDVIQMVEVPKGAFVIDGYINVVGDLDSGGAAIRLTVGDGGDADRYIAAYDPGAGGVTRFSATTMNYSTSPYTADDTIDITVSTGPTTGATAIDVWLCVRYALQT